MSKMLHYIDPANDDQIKAFEEGTDPKWLVGLKQITEAELKSRLAPGFEEIKFLINETCKKRILAVANENTQQNLVAKNGAGLMSDEDTQVYLEFLNWVDGMRSIAKELIIGQEQNPDREGVWAIPSDEILELVSRY